MCQADVISDAIKSLGNAQSETVQSVKPAQVLAALSKLRAEAASTEYMDRQRQNRNNLIVSLGASVGEQVEDSIHKVWRVYEELLTQRGALDFDLLLLKTIQLLERNAAVSETSIG